MLHHENGGIVTDTFFDNSFYKRNIKTIPTILDYKSDNTSNTTTLYRQAALQLQHQYMFGVYQKVTSQVDSSETEIFIPRLGIMQSIYGDFQYQRYKDVTPDSTYYHRIGAFQFANNDSLYWKQFVNTIGHNISLLLNLQLLQQTYQLRAGWGFELETPHPYPIQQTFVNNYINGNLQKKKTLHHTWQLEAEAKLYFTGNTKGNFTWQANMQKEIWSNLHFQLGGGQQLQQAPYVYQFLSANYFTLTQALKNTFTQHVYANATDTRRRIKIAADYYLLTNFTYRDSQWAVRQYALTFSLFQIYATKNFTYKGGVYQPTILIQLLPQDAPLHLPFFSTHQRLGIEKHVFHKKLLLASGIDMRWNSAYYADGYAPLFADFITQDQQKISVVPQVAIYVNAKVKRFRGSLSVGQLQQSLYNQNQLFQQYYAPGIQVRFGFNWAFIN